MTTQDTSQQATPVAQTQPARQGEDDAGRYFQYMAEYVGFTAADADAIRQTRPIIEKHLPEIVSKFYAHLLRYPPTRSFFLGPDGSLNQDYLELRMRHLSNFWLRTADAVFDDDYARYVDYVGRAHTARGADPNIYIAERYVIGQVGMMQHAISEAINRELSSEGARVEFPAAEAWDKLMMVVLELLARAYGQERQPERFDPLVAVDHAWVSGLAQEAVAKEHGGAASAPRRDVVVAAAADIPDGQRKIVQIGALSIGVFHHAGQWYAVRNSCIHRGGPVATGTLVGDTLTCPWHGFQFDLRTAKNLADPLAELDHYHVTVVDGQVHLQVPDSSEATGSEATGGEATGGALRANEFRLADVGQGRMKLLNVDGTDVTVYNVNGAFYATDDACTHADGPLHEGVLSGRLVTCPWHDSCFDVTNGAVTCPPATVPLRTWRVIIDGETGRVEGPIQAISG